jgi:hypothetical protein
MFKTFIAEAELKSSHAERYLTFIDQYHHEVFQDLKERLSKAWEHDVKSLKIKVDNDAATSAKLKTENPTLEITVISSPVKIQSTRSRNPVEAAPSVKVPAALTESQRDRVIKHLVNTAAQTMEELTKGWKEIFNHEKGGRIQPSFKVLKTEAEVRLQLIVSMGGQEEYKTLYVVRTDYKRPTSKVVDFDRLYLASLV